MQIDASLFEVLACPACHAPFVSPAADDVQLVCSGCALRFPVIDGIPVLLLADAVRGDGSPAQA